MTLLWDQAGQGQWLAAGSPLSGEVEPRPTFQSVSTAKRKVSEFS